MRVWPFRKRAQQAASVQKTTERREFVYLDEVSVISLLSSHLGAIPAEYTDTLTKSTTAELASGIEAGISVAKANLGSRMESTRTNDSQVVRKATIQATFKDLYKAEQGSLVVRPLNKDEEPPAVSNTPSLLAVQDGDPWIVPAGQLVRGKLVELEVELQAHSMFRASTIVSVFADMFQEGSELSAQVEGGTLRLATEINRFLEQLMAGLVPIESKVVDYRSVTIDGKEILVHKRVLDAMEPGHQIASHPVFLVGIAERSQFWKDIRRILFSGARMKVLCRLNHDGLNASWTPVKLVDVLREVSPEWASRIEFLGQILLRAVAEGDAGRSTPHDRRSLALQLYSRFLVERYNLEVSADEWVKIQSLIDLTPRALPRCPTVG